MRLYLWPKFKIVYPTNVKGQMYVPGVNWIFMAGCIGIVLHFKESKNMEAAFGLAVTLTMLSSTILINTWLAIKRVNIFVIVGLTCLFLFIETSFLIANLKKFPQGGWISIALGAVIMYIMFVWHKAQQIKSRLIEFEPFEPYLPVLRQLSNDTSVNQVSTNLIYLTSSNDKNKIESRIIYSLLNKTPKRADIYWFIHVNTLDIPYHSSYKVEILEENDVVWVTFNLGFRVEPRINHFFRVVVQELVTNKEIDITSRYQSLSYNKVKGDFYFILLKSFLSYENELHPIENFIMRNYFEIKKLAMSDQASYGLDTSNVSIESTPMILTKPRKFGLVREK